MSTDYDQFKQRSNNDFFLLLLFCWAYFCSYFTAFEYVLHLTSHSGVMKARLEASPLVLMKPLKCRFTFSTVGICWQRNERQQRWRFVCVHVCLWDCVSGWLSVTASQSVHWGHWGCPIKCLCVKITFPLSPVHCNGCGKLHCQLFPLSQSCTDTHTHTVTQG